MSRTKKSKKADIAVEYLLERLQGPEMAGNPSKQISCLYILKASFEKSPMPRMAEVCFEHNILNSLMEMLQKEFNPRDKTNEVVLYSLAMELLWLFSTLGRSSLGPLLSEHLLTLLTAYLDINHRFYQFSPFFTKKMESLCRSTRFLQQKVTTVPMTKEIWNDILFYKPCMAVCGAITHLHQCSLNIQVQGKPPVHSIAKRLISERLAWAKCPKEPAASHDPVVSGISELLHPQDYIPLQVDKLLDDDGEAEGCHEDVFVLDIIGGHYFWAYVGSEAMRTVDAITDQLLKEAPALKRFLPNVGNLVAVEEGGADGPSMMRGKVIEMGDDQVMVFAIDHGCMKRVTPSQIYQLSGSATCLANFGAQAKVCCLAGVQPPPAEEAAVEFALTTLTNLTKHFAPPGNIFEKAGGIDHLYELVRCASPGIKLQAIRLLSNISSIPHLSKSCDWTKFIRPLLGILTGSALPDTLVQLVRKEVPDNTSRNMMVATLYALTNIMFQKQMYHEVFFELQGHIIVLNLMRMFKTSIPIVRAAAAMLRTAYPGLMRTIPRDTKNADFSGGSGGAGAGGDRVEAEEGDEEMLVLQKRSQTAEEEFSDEEINYMMQHMMPKEEEDKSGTDSSSSRTGPSPVVSISSGSTTEESLGACGGTGEPRAACVGSDEGKPSAGSSLVPVDGGAIYRRGDSSYEYNTFVPFRDDPTHHLLDVEDISNISINKLSELICGMLNNRGGTIFMGLTKQGYIRGLKLDRNDRDSVRLGIDKIMTRTTPIIPHTQLQVNYVSVLHRVASGMMEPLPNRFVVEVVTRAPREPVYYTLGKAAVCYQRFGASTHQLTEQDVREMVVLEEESKYLPYVQSLRQKIRDLQQR